MAADAKKAVNLKIDPSLHKRAMVYARQNDMTFTDLIVNLLERELDAKELQRREVHDADAHAAMVRDTERTRDEQAYR